MAYDESLAARVRDTLSRRKGVEEKKMFGGLGFLLNGNLLVGVRLDSLLLRVGPDQAEEALLEDRVSEFTIKGRGSMNGWIVVESDAVEDDTDLNRWIDRATKFVRTLPAK